MTNIKLRTYSLKEHDFWVKEVKEIYQKVKSHSTSYVIDFLETQITVCPNVFSPKYFNNTKWYAERLPSIIGNSSLLEIGTGTGAIALHCCLKGANVTATDVNKDALNCAKLNFKNTNQNIPAFLGDVYETLPKESKFDFIFWNHPYNNSKEEIKDDLIMAGFDYNYNSLKKYIEGASQFLVDPNKGLLLGTGGHADLDTILDICTENNYTLCLLDAVNMPLSDGAIALNDFRIYELKKNIIMKNDDLWKIHSNVLDSVKVTDYKALTIFGVVGVLSTFYISVFKLDKPDFFKSDISLTLLLSSGFFFLISILISISAIFSNLKIIYSQKSNLFFKDISDNKDVNSFLNSFNSSYDLDTDLKTQIFANAKIATKKHILLQWSIRFLGLAVIGLTISLLSTLF